MAAFLESMKGKVGEASSGLTGNLPGVPGGENVTGMFGKVPGMSNFMGEKGGEEEVGKDGKKKAGGGGAGKGKEAEQANGAGGGMWQKMTGTVTEVGTHSI